jgi:hypothetical protein
MGRRDQIDSKIEGKWGKNIRENKQTNLNSTELKKRKKVKSANPFAYWNYWY